MSTVEDNLYLVHKRIIDAELRFRRHSGQVKLVAVSKGQPVERLQALIAAGHRAFGENYLQEAQEKMQILADVDLEWHFIGKIQSNKTAAIARQFQWVHSVCTSQIARRLSAARPTVLPPLNICIEVNTSGESSKSGIRAEEVFSLAYELVQLPGLRLRGLMAILAHTTDFAAQRASFHSLRALFDKMQQANIPVDTLSMGMSGDFEAAIAEGSTLVRVGTALFGKRSLAE